MKVSLHWLSDHLDLSGLTTAGMADLLTFAGVEVEGIEEIGIDSDLVVVGQILSSDPHPDADRLSVCRVQADAGEPIQIVCGAKNYAVGDKVPVALPGTVLPGGFAIKKGKLRGVESGGMMCSARELGIGDDHGGLMILGADAAVGAPIRSVVKPDTIFDLEITPNRPDLLSYTGIARELAALTGRALKSRASYAESEVPERSSQPEEVAIADPVACPFYTARIIRGVKVGPSPAWLQEKLAAAGLRPINNIVDITNFVLLEMGQPLHAFDMAKLNGGILVRPAQQGEEFLALDGETYALEAGDLVIADQSRGVAIGGVMGGEESGVTESTADVLLESAYFAPSHIRRTSRRLGLSSDSSYRFERGVDPHQVAGASELATNLILELAGGAADPELLTCGALPAAPEPVAFDLDRCNALLGSALGDDEASAILARLGLAKTEGGAWAVPTYRLDLQRPVDLTEEIARVYGLDKIPARAAAHFAEESAVDRRFDFAARARETLCGIGFSEAMTIKLIGADQVRDGLSGSPGIPVKNPLSDDHAVLRPSVVPGLLAALARNIRMGAPGIRLFEIGTVFGAGEAEESQSLGIVAAGDAEPRTWQAGEPRAVSLFDVKGAVEALCPGAKFKPCEREGLFAAAEVSVGKKAVGVIGMLHPSRARDLDAEGGIYVAEIDLAALHAAA
ncbi:MAG: phenylalanine--tRNA ligase subunit beta, partial [Verrucomicrobiales bacterium]